MDAKLRRRLLRDEPTESDLAEDEDERDDMDRHREMLRRRHMLDDVRNDATDALFAAMGQDMIPGNHACLREFMFVHCTLEEEFSNLFGMYQGLRIVSESLKISTRELKTEVRQALQAGQLVTYVRGVYDRYYRIPGAGTSYYWRWFMSKQATFRDARPPASSPRSIPLHSRVRIEGLVSAAHLNDATGTVLGPPNALSGRLPVLLDFPHTAVLSQPTGVSVRVPNLRVVTAFNSAVQVDSSGGEWPVLLTDGEAADCAERIEGWQRCAVPTLLGVPLAVLRLAVAPPPDRYAAAEEEDDDGEGEGHASASAQSGGPASGTGSSGGGTSGRTGSSAAGGTPDGADASGRPAGGGGEGAAAAKDDAGGERDGSGGGLAALLLVKPSSGRVETQPLGPVFVARMDGVALHVDDLAPLRTYICHLVDKWPPSAAEWPAWQRRVLTPAAYQEFCAR